MFILSLCHDNGSDLWNETQYNEYDEVCSLHIKKFE